MPCWSGQLGGWGNLGAICQPPFPAETCFHSPWSTATAAWWWEGIPGWWCFCLGGSGLGGGTFWLLSLSSACHSSATRLGRLSPWSHLGSSVLLTLTPLTGLSCSLRLGQLHVFVGALPGAPHSSQWEQRMDLLIAPLCLGCFSTLVGGHHHSCYQCYCKRWLISGDSLACDFQILGWSHSWSCTVSFNIWWWKNFWKYVPNGSNGHCVKIKAGCYIGR